ncbi:MAG: GNAT family N-acetyltransferase [Bacteroidales bacterium]|nr:GNAT family N-acetyltransferase [Bacteroidales bacterium]
MVEFVTFDQSYLEKSWEWLNDPEIKKLTNTPDFTKDQQLKWFKKLPELSDYLIRGIEIDHCKAGVCGLKNITETDAEYWGYIGVKSLWGKGYGKIILQRLLNTARELNLKSVWLQVEKENIRAMRLYERSRFKAEDTEGSLQIMRIIL